MKKTIIISSLLLAMTSTVMADPPQVSSQYVCGAQTSGANIWCNPGNANGTSPFPVTTTSTNLTAVAGTQRGLSIASATSLTVPSGATTAVIQAQGTNNSSSVCLYWQDDGTAPTASAGQQLSAGASMFYKVSTLPIQLIAATGATCTATISYYK